MFSITFQKKSFISVSLFVLAVIIQYGLFRTYAVREVSWGYPAFHDQCEYLIESYWLHEDIKSKGSINAVKSLLSKNFPPQGILLQHEASFLYFLIGPSRLSALTLNFIHFILLQIVLFAVFRKITQSWLMAWIPVALIWFAKTTFYIAGGITDFRLDFPALCLFGIYLTVIIFSQSFLVRKFSVIAAVIGIILMLTRTIFAVYLAGILITFTLALAIFLFVRKSVRRENICRLKNIFLSVLIMFVVGAPYLWFARNAIKNYYFIGHIMGSEKKIRAVEAGIQSLSDHLRYYPDSLMMHHLGKNVLIEVIALIFLFIIARFIILKYFSAQEEQHPLTEELFASFETFVFLLSSFLLPLLILTANTAKSPVVANTLVMPVILLFSLLFVILFFRKQSTKLDELKMAVVMIIILFGSSRQLKGYMNHGIFANRSYDVKQIVKMYCDIGSYLEKIDNRQPYLSTNYASEFLSNNVLMPVVYEQQGVILRAYGMLGHSIFAISQDEALRQIDGSDIVVLMDQIPEKIGLPYPFYDSIRKIKPAIDDKVNKEFQLLNRYSLRNNGLTVFVRPTFVIKGMENDGWINSEGIICELNQETDQKARSVEFTAEYPSRWLKNELKIKAYVVGPDANRELPVSADLRENDCTIHCELPSTDQSGLKIKISFLNYFIPKEIGISGDDRKLVIKNPKQRKIIF